MDEVAAIEEQNPPVVARNSTSFKKDVAFASITQAGVGIGSYFQYFVILRFWPASREFAAYSDLFRARVSTEAVVLLVLTSALAWKISALAHDADRRSRAVYTWVGLGLGLLLMLIATGMARLFPNVAALILFGNTDMAGWIGPFCNLLFGCSFASMVYSILRGYMHYRLANLTALCYSGTAPLLCGLLLHRSRLEAVVSATGLAGWITGAAFLIILMRVEPEVGKMTRIGLDRALGAAKDLLGYGAPRVIAVGLYAIFTLLFQWMAFHLNEVRFVGALNAVLLILAGTTIAVSGLSFVLLPRFSAMFASGHTREAQRQLRIVIEFSLFLGGLGALASVGLLGPFLNLWVGSKIASFPILVSAASVAIPAAFLSEILRGPIDAASRKPWNAVPFAVAIVVGLVTTKTLVDIQLSLSTALSISMVMSYVASSFAALAITDRLYGFEPAGPKAAMSLALMTALLGFLLFEKAHWTPWVLVSASALACIIHILFACLMRPAWLTHITPKRIRARLSIV